MAPLLLKTFKWIKEDMDDLPEGHGIYVCLFDVDVVAQAYVQSTELTAWFMRTLETVRVGGGTSYTKAIQLANAFSCDRLYIVSDLYGELHPDVQVPDETYWVDIDGETPNKVVPGGKGDRITPLGAS
jgi:hypothetical protein